MAMRSDAVVYKRHWAYRLRDLDRRCEFGGAGRQSDWERARSGADTGRRQRERRGRIGRKWGFAMGRVRKEQMWRRFREWMTLVRSIDEEGRCYRNSVTTLDESENNREQESDEAKKLSGTCSVQSVR